MRRDLKGAREAKSANNIDCEHYNKHRCNCKLLKKLYCTLEDKPCSFHNKPTTGGAINKE